MLRTIVFTAFAQMTIFAASTGAAFAQPHANRTETIPSPLGQEVRSDDGSTVLGRVSHVSRDHRGRIVAVEVPGLEPADAPRAPVNAIAENDLRLSSASATRDGGGIFESSERESR